MVNQVGFGSHRNLEGRFVNDVGLHWNRATLTMSTRLMPMIIRLGSSLEKQVWDEQQKLVLERLGLWGTSGPKFTKFGTMPHRYQQKVLAKARKCFKEVDKLKEKDVIQLGAMLLDILLRHCTMPNGEPAFVHEVIKVQTKDNFLTVGTIKAHDMLSSLIEPSQMKLALTSSPVWMPMVMPPRQWGYGQLGGYFIRSGDLIRHTSPDPETAKLIKHPDTCLDQVYNALNALGSVPWRINRRIFDVVEALWEGGGGVAALPTRRDTPATVAFTARRPSFRAKTLDVTAGKLPADWDMIARVEKRNRELHSLRCDFELKLAVARDYLEDELYFPHSLDFRGRAYPMPPHLNHLGGDVSRGLLHFSEAKPLGPDGLFWLQIQLANSYGNGMDKLPYHERVVFVRDNLPLIFACADSPTTNQWWLGADNPLQFLAGCFEVADAFRSPDPTAYKSRLPVQMDGSCNGLQHYAALGRDLEGGMAVNLRPADRPQDVYSRIAKLVFEIVARDAESGDPRAIALLPAVDRKLVKQTVMTCVYGVTYVGARIQIQNRLRERGWDYDDRVTYTCACYGAHVTLQAVAQMFQGARGIMDWLTQCAKLIAHQNKPVRWTTPLGLPCGQPYVKNKKVQVCTAVCKVVLQDSSDAGRPGKDGRKKERQVSKSRQRTAFPPNYIHSLDSSHMMMTATRCQAAAAGDGIGLFQAEIIMTTTMMVMMMMVVVVVNTVGCLEAVLGFGIFLSPPPTLLSLHTT
eukprot:jgi/Botrbrau1/5454/Bobra.27_1s0005.1